MFIVYIVIGYIAYKILIGWEKLEKENKEKLKKKEKNSFFSERPKKRTQWYSEEEMDKYFLKEWQKELVREGRFAPWSFKKKSTSSEELSDGQYHKEDS